MKKIGARDGIRTRDFLPWEALPEADYSQFCEHLELTEAY